MPSSHEFLAALCHRNLSTALYPVSRSHRYNMPREAEAERMPFSFNLKCQSEPEDEQGEQENQMKGKRRWRERRRERRKKSMEDQSKGAGQERPRRRECHDPSTWNSIQNLKKRRRKKQQKQRWRKKDVEEAEPKEERKKSVKDERWNRGTDASLASSCRTTWTQSACSFTELPCMLLLKWTFDPISSAMFKQSQGGYPRTAFKLMVMIKAFQIWLNLHAGGLEREGRGVRTQCHQWAVWFPLCSASLPTCPLLRNVRRILFSNGMKFQAERGKEIDQRGCYRQSLSNLGESYAGEEASKEGESECTAVSDMMIQLYSDWPRVCGLFSKMREILFKEKRDNDAERVQDDIKSWIIHNCAS